MFCAQKNRLTTLQFRPNGPVGQARLAGQVLSEMRRREESEALLGWMGDGTTEVEEKEKLEYPKIGVRPIFHLKNEMISICFALKYFLAT